jgi:hypothetical protein
LYHESHTDARRHEARTTMTTVWLGGGALAASAVVYVASLAAVRRADRAYPSTRPAESSWWFGYARDGVNMLGFLAFSGGFALLSLRGPLALLAGASLTLVIYGLDYLFSRYLEVERATLATGAAALALAALAGLGRDGLERALGAVVGSLF